MREYNHKKMRLNWNFIHLFLEFYVVPICKMCSNSKAKQTSGCVGETQSEPNELGDPNEIENTNTRRAKISKENNAKQQSLHQMVLHKVCYVDDHMLQFCCCCRFHADPSINLLLFLNLWRGWRRKMEEWRIKNLPKFKMYKLCWLGNLKSDLYKCHSNQCENHIGHWTWSAANRQRVNRPSHQFNYTNALFLFFSCRNHQIRLSTICFSTHIASKMLKPKYYLLSLVDVVRWEIVMCPLCKCD